MLDICGVPPEKFRTTCSSIDKLDKQPFEQIKKEMVEEKGLSADEIGTFVKERGQPLELLSKLKQQGSKFLGHNGSVDALNDLEILFKALKVSKCIDKVVFDLSLARGLDYYTGVIFEAVFKGDAQVGSIAAGGRYDNLNGMFGAKQVPSVGVSLGIGLVFAIMEQLQKDQSQRERKGFWRRILLSHTGGRGRGRGTRLLLPAIAHRRFSIFFKTDNSPLHKACYDLSNEHPSNSTGKFGTNDVTKVENPKLHEDGRDY
nr:histidine--trna ligase, cytoplasmic [Quercus suber]